MAHTESEFRSYPLIQQILSDMGWDVRSPSKGGQVYTQNEATKQNTKLKEALGSGRPEYTVVVNEADFWVIEAKANEKQLTVALDEAKGRAESINSVSGIQCLMVTGFAGSPDGTHYIETHCLVAGEWRPLEINQRSSTGFISPEQARQVLLQGQGRLDDYDVADELFQQKAKEINELLHNGAFHKRNRAGVLACLLLALANDQQMPVSSDLSTLIGDINTRARNQLQQYRKEAFYNEIELHHHTSNENHVKNKNALTQAIGILRDLNIASAINSGRDVLGQCYEQFLTYASDAKEVGIVLTPRHITTFAASIIDIQKDDIVFDPTCGTGGFLVAALDKVRQDNGNLDSFKEGNLYGVEQDKVIAALAIVNMVFRGDGSSNIIEGNSLTTNLEVKPDKVLMNPPFALANEPEWQFVDKALEQMRSGGLLFAVLPATAMSSSGDGRGEKTWRQNLLKRHTLLAVIKLPEDLFYPHASKGTYGVVLRAHKQHSIDQDKVIWAMLEDGKAKVKTQRSSTSNMAETATAVGNYIATKTEPAYIPEVMDCSVIRPSVMFDLSPEKHIGVAQHETVFDVKDVLNSIAAGNQYLSQHASTQGIGATKRCGVFRVHKFFETIEAGKSGRKKDLAEGELPLISTSERNNGISGMVNKAQCKQVYQPGLITVSRNGSSCCAHFHSYEFAANADVLVCRLKPEYNNRNFAIFLCASINSENWRFNYFRKLTQEQFAEMEIKLPVTKSQTKSSGDDNGNIDHQKIEQLISSS